MQHLFPRRSLGTEIPDIECIFYCDSVFERYSVQDILDHRSEYSKAEQHFRLSESLNEKYEESLDIYVNHLFQLQDASYTRTQLVNGIGMIIAHEIGHAVGLYHPKKDMYPFDIMTQREYGWDFTAGVRRFQVSGNALKVALGMDWTEEEAIQAINYYVEIVGYGIPAVKDGLLWVLDSNTGSFVANWDFGITDIGAPVSHSFVLRNVGDQPATVNSIRFRGSSRLFVEGLRGKQLIAPGESIPFTVTFDPSTTGADTATLVVESDGLNSTLEVPWSGFGRSNLSHASVSTSDHNLGGVRIANSEAASQPEFASITNHGAQPLVVGRMQLVEGSGRFSLVGVPLDLASNPVTLGFNEKFTFGINFVPDHIGFDRATIEIVSNDPDQPLIQLGAVGIGLDSIVYPQWGGDFVAIETGEGTRVNVLRTQSDEAGNFSLFLPSNQRYHITIFDPFTGLVSHGYGRTPDSGRDIDLTANLVFGASTAPDTDFDGLPDDIENAIGTSLGEADTDGDGLDDFTEIQQGLDPLGGRGFPTAVVASLNLEGKAREISVEGSILAPERQTAYVATGSNGLAIVDASRFDRPIILGQVDLPGEAIDVAVDSRRGIAVVASGFGGLHFVDVVDPTRPQLVWTVNVNAEHVEIVDGVAYAATGSRLDAYDVLTGSRFDSVVAGATTITGLAREGQMLYSMDANRQLQLVDISGFFMQLRGALATPVGGGKLFVGNGIAYVAAGNGFATVDVADADRPRLISGADAANLEGTAIVSNGSGLAIGVGAVLGPTGPIPALDLLDVFDPGNTAGFLTRINLPSSPQSVAIAGGLAFVAGGIAGLQVVNYLPFDNRGEQPNVTISAADVDLDPAKPGIQVLEGMTIPIRADVKDDVQVRNVELIVNGRVVTNDVSFPFDLSAVALPISADNLKTTVQVRATDTGGNAALTTTPKPIQTPPLPYSALRSVGTCLPSFLPVVLLQETAMKESNSKLGLS